jgi:hypothetical protein
MDIPAVKASNEQLKTKHRGKIRIVSFFLIGFGLLFLITWITFYVSMDALRNQPMEPGLVPLFVLVGLMMLVGTVMLLRTFDVFKKKKI